MAKTRKRNHSKKGGRPTTRAGVVKQFLLSGNFALRKKYKTCKHYKDKYTNLIKKCNKEIEKINIKINNNVKDEENCKPYPTIRIYDSSTPIAAPENIYETPVYKTPESISLNSRSLSLPRSLPNKNPVPPTPPPRILNLQETTLQRKKTPPQTYFNPLPFKGSPNRRLLNETMRGNTQFKKTFYGPSSIIA